MVNRLIKSI